MSLRELIPLLILPVFLLLDLLRGQAPSGVGRWRLRAFAVSNLTFAVSLATGALYAALFAGVALLPGERLGTLGGALAGFVTYEFFHYWYHRMAHRFNAVWRLGHQMHHSPEVVDPWGAYFLHPLDAFFFLTISGVLLYPVLGLTPAAGAWAVALITFAAVFEHASFATPRWVGYLLQRPESHAIHHARGVHAFNYAGLPLWDMVFGTFRNPPVGARRPRAGFYDGASLRIGEMLAFKDVSRPDGA